MTHLDVQWLANVADEIGWGSPFRETLYTMGPSPSLTDEEQCLQSLRRVLSVPRICPSAAHFGLNALLADVLAIQNWFTYRFPMQELFGVILDCCDCTQDACWAKPSGERSSDLPTQPSGPQSRLRSTEQLVGGSSDIRTSWLTATQTETK